MILWPDFTRLGFACVSRIYTFGKDILVPPICWQCRYLLQQSEQGHGLCIACLQGISSVAPSELIDRSQSISVYAVGSYVGVIQRLICAKKNGDVSASRVMGKLVACRFTELCTGADLLVPVPLYWSRRAVRGYNQADIMANVIHEYTGIPVVHALKRMVYTASQKGLSGAERRENVAYAFAVNKKVQEKLIGARIMLVDDLVTTGSTLIHASRALRSVRVGSISAVVAGKVVL